MSAPARSGRWEIRPTVRHGHEPAECVSALQKSIRRGLEDDAIYFAVELDLSGYGEWAWRRLRVISSEDVGLASPGIAAEIGALYTAWADFKKKAKEGGQEAHRLFLVHAVLLLARARKSRIVDHALIAAYADTQRREIPDVALDKHTAAGRKLGRGWDHFFEEGSLLADETGELCEAPSLPDPYRERAEAATAQATDATEAKGAAMLRSGVSRL